ncbi:KamA family radical SAM protein [Actinokineospora sp.]|uniref:KamA family radical SAM protein n=1 Tax=Actinokineospora sp. TaxID=1872133 RepID=UPI004037B367
MTAVREVAEAPATTVSAAIDQAGRQPYEYVRRELVEPDWRRFPGWAHVTDAQWRDAQWQRVNCVKNAGQLRKVVGDQLAESFYDELAADQELLATMSMLLPPQMLNTMAPAASAAEFTDAFFADPVRRYMLPVRSDRDPEWPSHPHSERDSLHEAEMWVVEGLTHRYPTKVLAELISTCPQYCGHCTRMDLVGNSTPQVDKHKLLLKPVDRQDLMVDYLRRTPGVRDVVVSGGDVANVPWKQLESFLMRLLDIETVRDIRLATKALAGLPQHWLQDSVVEGLERVARTAARRGVNLAIHTHVNHAQSVTPLVAEAARTALEVGVRDVRNQGVLMRGVNATPEALLDLCFALQGEANILPYYFYMCDMIPNAEHWRVAVWEAQELQHAIMGYLPGYATPRIICDVPYVGKRWVHQLAEYDRELGVSYWTKNYRAGTERMEAAEAEAILTRRYPYYDPIATLPAAGQRFWRDNPAHQG